MSSSHQETRLQRLKRFFRLWDAATKEAALDKVNEIPNAAILASENARNPLITDESGIVHPSRETGNPHDPYSEERVSRDQPEIKTVRNSPPDDQVLPG